MFPLKTMKAGYAEKAYGAFIQKKPYGSSYSPLFNGSLERLGYILKIVIETLYRMSVNNFFKRIAMARKSKNSRSVGKKKIVGDIRFT